MNILELNLNEACLNCDLIKNKETDLEKARKKCANCKKIYKYDAIVELVNIKTKNKLNAGKGKTAKLFSRYSKIIAELRKQNRTMREIAEICNISLGSVHKILKQIEGE